MDTPASNTTQYVIEEIRALMGRRRMSQKQLGDALKLSAPAISKRMNGRISFNLDELEIVAETFDVPITDLLPPARYTDPGAGSRNRWSSSGDEGAAGVLVNA